ncbi:hypothetical protein KJK34_02695 [Flavobacterium sp. D11R37]|uniref:HD domain-containing protein n=1 Tax=Flavobacterium coralii TaxID=2838017 RepID=UPI001CA79BE0|nr:hypothetical protein [Flavobacterium coralii]MBY8961654.1 hypothetical protein [Flavobacterium coralii]
MDLKDTFRNLVAKYAKDVSLTENLWRELELQYSAKGRYYHTLEHLQHMLNMLVPVLKDTEDTDSLLFALFYHDFVYIATSGQNEENSAKAATKCLKAIGFPEQKITLCCEHIIATKKHENSGNSDTNLLLDADLSILGSSQEEYDIYCKQIRREYAIYPDVIYKPGRRKVIKHFLEMDYIYKTLHFRQLFESKAKSNLKRELELL